MSTLEFDQWNDAGGNPVMRINGGALQVWDGSAWVAPGAGTLEATGGTEVTSGGYKYHTFTSSGTLTVSKAGLCEVLVIAGGASGGRENSDRGCGGGGAGGLGYYGEVYFDSDVTVTVGAGGAGATTNGDGNPGNFSQVGPMKVPGGGPGSHAGKYGQVGACGGGNGDRLSVVPQVLPGWGFRGGSTSGTDPDSGAGGGGMGAVGASVSSGQGGAGGAGIDTYSTWATATSTGESGYYCGGGAGHGESSAGTGGIGGGGNGNGGSGDANTGGGGGARRGGNSGAGGSGLVIVRYAV